MIKKLIMLVVGIAAAMGIAAVPANATPNAYFNTLENDGVVIWDYPMMLRTGYDVCDLLWNDVNPWSYLVYNVGYDSYTASSIITSARVGLCPGNAVTRV